MEQSLPSVISLSFAARDWRRYLLQIRKTSRQTTSETTTTMITITAVLEEGLEAPGELVTEEVVVSSITGR